ncbi:MAG: T9SS type A sorting domain-containing protein, partial [Candidatus Syntrophosphaera sp.]|nr:T9SS type A sorting domain-containing protein [Candidatus Syntrophosphaera sp.]
DWLWARGAGGSNSDNAYASATDGDGATYITGRFYSAATFGSHLLTSLGGYDIFVAKLDAEGNWLWAKRAGGGTDESGRGIAIGGNGKIYLTGEFNGMAHFGNIILQSVGGTEVFAACLDSSGNWLWARRAGGINNDEAKGVAADADGNCYITGRLSGSGDFGATTLYSAGNDDIFVAKLNEAGNWLWAERAGGTENDCGYAVAVDNDGNCLVTGEFQGSADFGKIDLASSAYHDICVAKLHPDGNWIWAVSAGGSGSDWGSGICADPDGNCYVTGAFGSAATFGPFSLVSQGAWDCFAVKLGFDGEWIWARRAGGANSDYGVGISTNGNGYIHVTGRFQGTAGFGASTLESAGNFDAFAAKISAAGNWIWAVRGGGTGNDLGQGSGVDNAGNSYFTGYYEETGIFGPHPLVSMGSSDVFVAKLSVGGVPTDDPIIPGAQSSSALYGAFPNPARRGEAFQIKAHVAERETGTLSIYNLRGACLERRQIGPGDQQISFDGSEFPSGVYLCRLKTGSQDYVRKLVLLK